MTTHKTTLYINSGTCVCGCSWEDHHLSIIMNQAAWKAIEAHMKAHHPDKTYPMYVPGECDNFGFDEVGGMKYNEETDEWEDHCHAYRDKDGPLGVVEWESI